MSKIKNGGLDQYGAEPFKQQQFGTAGIEGVSHVSDVVHEHLPWCFILLTYSILAPNVSPAPMLLIPIIIFTVFTMAAYVICAWLSLQRVSVNIMKWGMFSVADLMGSKGLSHSAVPF